MRETLIGWFVTDMHRVIIDNMLLKSLQKTHLVLIGILKLPSLSLCDTSCSAVLAELVADEPDYCHSLELLAMVYHPMFALRNVPTFLQGRGDAVLPNIGEIYNNHR